jgi:hypothetical protein
VNPQPDVYAHWEFNTIRQATLWWIGEDMVDLLLATAATIPDDVLISELPKFQGSGLIVFAKPWRGRDVGGGDVQVDAMLYGGAHLQGLPNRPATSAVSLSSYRRLSYDDGLNSSELTMAATLGSIHHATFTDPSKVRPGGAVLAVSHPAGHGTIGVLHDDLPPEMKELPNQGLAGPDLVDAIQHAPTFRLEGSSWCPLGRSDWPKEDRLGTAPWEMTEDTLGSFTEDNPSGSPPE